MGEERTLALVGATGGAGTTTLSVEFGATLGRAGRSAAVLDAAFATQGLADRIPGRIDPDVTALVLDREERDFEAGPVEPWEVDGRLALCPARAPFARLARAKAPAAAERFGDRIREAARTFDYVVVDTPPVAANQAVAAATAADRVALVAPADRRGADALVRMADRLADVGAGVDLVVANRAGGDQPVDWADAAVPESDALAAGGEPACLDPATDAAPAVADAVEAAFDTELDLEFPQNGLVERYLRR